MVRKHSIRDMHRAAWVHFTQPNFRVGHMQEISSHYCHERYGEDVGGRVTNVKGGEEAEANIT